MHGQFLRIAPVLVAALLFGACTRPDHDPELPDRIDYNRHVRPILSNACYVCHGPDASTREADLRLDVREAATARRKGGRRAVVPGSARRSLLIGRVTAELPETRMPPPEANKTLSARDIALLRRWIDQGAEYGRPWALTPPEMPVLPPGPGSPIDRLIDARLAAHGLTAAPEASREALIRRASSVLTGLPPSPDEVEAFVTDTSRIAYERLVDRLLASPRYGERWARHWMDLVRYAETKGHEFDFTIEGAWHYRDWLIRAFNADVPYERFVIEHIAGDLIADPRLHPTLGFNESVIGTAHYVLGEGKHAPVDSRLDEADRIDNIIDVTTKTFQGMTLACARCHDHKFDQLPTADYYSLYGILESTRFAPTPILTSDYHARLDTLRAVRRDLRRAAATAWADSQADAPHVERPSAPVPADSSGDWRMLGDFRGGTYDGWFPHGPGFEDEPRQGLPILRDGRIDSLSYGIASSRSLAERVPGALRSPTFTIEHDSLHVRTAGFQSSIRIVVDNFQLIVGPIFTFMDLKVSTPELHTYRFDVSLWKGRKAYVELLVGAADKTVFITEIHRLRRSDSSWVEAAWAHAFSGEAPAIERPEPAARDLSRAVRDWEAGRATPGQAAAMNGAL